MKKLSDPFGLGALERFATSFRADYRFGPLNIMVLLAICLAGLSIHVAVYPFDIKVVITMLGTALSLAVLLRLSQVWETALIFTTLAGLFTFLRHRPESAILVGAVVAAGILAPCIQMAYRSSWNQERAISSSISLKYVISTARRSDASWTFPGTCRRATAPSRAG
jgi:hypothetical protein